jgi:addiction module RelB/DinJ family antitoxin
VTTAGKTANISLEIDSGIKQHAMAVLEARGMSLSGAVRRMVTLGIMEHRIPIEITREPEVAGIGMSDEDAKYYGAPKDDTDGRNGITCGISIKMPPQDKKAMRE